VGSLAVVAASSFAAAIAPPGIGFFVALAVYGPASGCALAVAEGALVEADPSARERAMARVGIAGSTGDLAVPLVLALFGWIGLGWRAAFVSAGASAVVLAIVHACTRELDEVPRALDDDGETPTMRAALRTALDTPCLLAWSLACASTALLDEVLVAFAALHLDAIGATAAVRSLALASWVVGGFVGLGVMERFVDSSRARRALVVASVVTAIALVVLAITRSPIVASCALFFVGAFGGTLHPLTKARSYAALPSRPAIVNALASAFLPLDIVAPLVLGLVAARAGNAWALSGLLLAPFAVVITTFSTGRRNM
jgi:predicted MFS family arabinose efflux permease